jgi:hypothetical protein
MQTEAGFLPIPPWMANYAAEKGIDPRRFVDGAWLPVYKELRNLYQDGLSVVVELLDGEDLCGDVVMNTASFCAIEEEDGTVWAVDWRLFPFE